ncbi:MATE family efflux transporter [Jutongia sp.]|uniref:MATE family efflux transporter n=2 Tax=Jutongia sp. TaxID=2944204 RepID=UPI000338428F|nr:putative efflux protein MATE family [Clostridium sp. CAG:277]
MRERSVYKKALTLAVPMMIQNGITNAVSLVDNLMVGSLGTESLTAVSIVGQLIFVFFLAVFGGLSGPGIYGAQYFGQGNKKGFQNVFRLKLWITAVIVLVGMTVFVAGGEQLIGLYLHGSSQGMDAAGTLEQGRDYLHIMLFGLIPFAFTQIYAGSLREMGESMKPMVAGIVSVFVDIIFNYLLIYGKFGFPRLEVQGAAIATVMARFVEMLVVVVWTHASIRRYEFLRGIYSTILLPLHEAKIMIMKGFPIFLNEFLWAGGMAALTQCYSMKGLQVIAGLNISNAICNLLNVVFVAMGNAVGIIIGQHLGASEFEKAKRSAGKLQWFTAGLCLILTVILAACSMVFPSLYDTTEEVRHLGQWFIIITAVFFPIQGVLNVFYFTLRSGGKTVITFLFDSVFTWVVSVSLAFALCSYTALPVLAVYALVQSADLVKVVAGHILVKKGVWITNLVVN